MRRTRHGTPPAKKIAFFCVYSGLPKGHNEHYDSDKKNRPLFRAYRKADGIIFQSEFNRKLLEHFAGEPPCPNVVIPNGVPPNFCPEGNRVDYGFDRTVICSAKWKAHKRLDSIIEGFLEYGNSDVGLVILGGGVGKIMEHENIICIGKIPPDDLPKYLRGGDVFIHLAWLDHCPNSVVEALACGLPVLCSHNGGTKEIVGSNGIVMKFEQEYDFAKVPVFRPPQCDKRRVADGIARILDWKKPIDASYLKLDIVADRYMKFAESLF